MLFISQIWLYPKLFLIFEVTFIAKSHFWSLTLLSSLNYYFLKLIFILGVIFCKNLFMFYLWSYFNARSNYLFLKLRLSPSYFHSLKLAVIRLSLKLFFISDVYFYLKSILMFEVTFNVWSYSHLWIYSFLELGFISGVFLLRSYFSSLKVLLFFGASFCFWSCFLSLKKSSI